MITVNDRSDLVMDECTPENELHVFEQFALLRFPQCCFCGRDEIPLFPCQGKMCPGQRVCEQCARPCRRCGTFPCISCPYRCKFCKKKICCTCNVACIACTAHHCDDCAGDTPKGMVCHMCFPEVWAHYNAIMWCLKEVQAHGGGLWTDIAIFM